jgi:hypothetical protein
MGSGTTKFKKTEITRIVSGVAASKAEGTLEFQLALGLIKFHMSSGTDAVGPADDGKQAVNPWDKVLKNGKAKPALTVVKKVP